MPRHPGELAHQLEQLVPQYVSRRWRGRRSRRGVGRQSDQRGRMPPTQLQRSGRGADGRRGQHFRSCHQCAGEIERVFGCGAIARIVRLQLAPQAMCIRQPRHPLLVALDRSRMLQRGPADRATVRSGRTLLRCGSGRSRTGARAGANASDRRRRAGRASDHRQRHALRRGSPPARRARARTGGRG